MSDLIVKGLCPVVPPGKQRLTRLIFFPMMPSRRLELLSYRDCLSGGPRKGPAGRPVPLWESPESLGAPKLSVHQSLLPWTIILNSKIETVRNARWY